MIKERLLVVEVTRLSQKGQPLFYILLSIYKDFPF